MILKSIVRTVQAGIALVILAGCVKHESASEGHEDKPSLQSRLHLGANGDVTITVDAETEQRMGLRTTVLAKIQLQPEVKAFGRVLDVGPLSAAAADLAAARADADASQKELARLKTLAQHSNAPLRTVESAAATVQRDLARVTAIHQRLLMTWGRAIVEREDLAGFVASLTTGDSVLVRLDLLPGEFLESAPLGARVERLAGDGRTVEAKLIAAAPAVDQPWQGQGFLFLVSPNEGRFTPGSAVSGFLRTTGEASAGVLMPREALLHFNGVRWAFLQTGDETYQRREVTPELPLADGWFVRHGWKAGDRVVTVGAQLLLSEERREGVDLEH